MEDYLEKMVIIFREIKRVLRPEGTLWLNLGDKSIHSWCGQQGKNGQRCNRRIVPTPKGSKIPKGLKPKDIAGIPWRVAFALQDDGWYLRQDIIWCLSGGTYLYAKTQKGEMPITVKDIARLDPKTVKLWNGKKWTKLLGMSRSDRIGDEIEIVLRSGERISCTPAHRFPTNRGLLEASEIKVGDILESCRLPEPESPKDCAIDVDAAWFAGLYIANGSHSDETIQISGNSKNNHQWERIQKTAIKYGGSATRTVNGNCMNMRIYGKVLNSIIDELVSGKTARDKGFAPAVWKFSNKFIQSMLDGYLSGDGYWDESNNRWRIGFTRNYNLERDLRTACARLGYHIVLKFSSVEYQDKQLPTFRGEIRFERNGHWNEKSPCEVIKIQKARCRQVYDLGVEDEPHLFSLTSGVLTHNSKPNPMPESVKDRPTKSHEYIFLFSKSRKYYYDYKAIMEPASPDTHARYARGRSDHHKWADGGPGNQSIAKSFDHMLHPGVNPKAMMAVPPSGWNTGKGSHDPIKHAQGNNSERFIRSRQNPSFSAAVKDVVNFRNKRSVWSVPTCPYSRAHFATFPPALIRPCILAGCPEGGGSPRPFWWIRHDGCGRKIIKKKFSDNRAQSRIHFLYRRSDRYPFKKVMGPNPKEEVERQAGETFQMILIHTTLLDTHGTAFMRKDK
jgi:hypothetical protein